METATAAQAPPSYQEVNVELLQALQSPGRQYWAALAFCVALILWGAWSWNYQLVHGMYVYGATHPAMWGTYIVNFVFWVGIAHSGTLISAILFLFRAQFRRAIYRMAEAMTVFAVMTAGLFPIIHVGRSWNIYFAVPYPNQRELWVNFRSPLVWDVFAVSTYFTVSSIFLYTGLIPDIAAARDRETRPVRKFVYTILSLGWRGTQSEWKHFNAAYLYLAAFATPLVISVHSVVSWDFAMSVNPGWHSTIFAPYFVAGAIFSGVGLVLTIAVPMRKILHLERWITLDHFDKMAKLCLFTSLIVGYSYLVEFFLAWYHGDPFERHVFLNRAFGPMGPEAWIMITCNAIIPLVLFWKKIRRSPWTLFVISLFINLGMWMERFVIVVQSLTHPFDPSVNTATYHPGIIETGIFVGSFGWFFAWFLLFARFLPIMAVAEIKEVMPLRRGAGGGA
ncbi:MAG TPA: NrfD/PsrC family molybdoenzyme membrane anchor subunit [Candidatus Saccharimonadales bacterium]|nr:NrfD/PsrC family molybdoenzyme membrane anchor subunit [Candidatus Saccharimonadales bacterium]